MFGCVAGIVPWSAITIYLLGADTVPGFVYGIFVSLFVFVLSFVAKTLLAWRIFANVLV